MDGVSVHLSVLELPDDQLHALRDSIAHEISRRRYGRKRSRAVKLTEDGFRGIPNKRVKYRDLIRKDPCCYCGGPGGTVDHIVPRGAGGDNDVTNLTGSCFDCNNRKTDTSLLLYLRRHPIT